MVILIKNQLYNLMKIRVTVGSRSDFQRQVESQIADVFFRNLSAFPRDSWCYTSQLCAFHQGPMDSFFTSTPSSKFKLSRNQQSSAVGVLEAGDLTPAVQKCLHSSSSFERLCFKELLCCKDDILGCSCA